MKAWTIYCILEGWTQGILDFTAILIAVIIGNHLYEKFKNGRHS